MLQASKRILSLLTALTLLFTSAYLPVISEETAPAQETQTTVQAAEPKPAAQEAPAQMQEAPAHAQETPKANDAPAAPASDNAAAAPSATAEESAPPAQTQDQPAGNNEPALTQSQDAPSQSGAQVPDEGPAGEPAAEESAGAAEAAAGSTEVQDTAGDGAPEDAGAETGDTGADPVPAEGETGAQPGDPNSGEASEGEGDESGDGTQQQGEGTEENGETSQDGETAEGEGAEGEGTEEEGTEGEGTEGEGTEEEGTDEEGTEGEGEEGEGEGEEGEEEEEEEGEEDEGDTYRIPGSISPGSGIVYRHKAHEERPSGGDDEFTVYRALRDLEVLYLNGSASMPVKGQSFTWTVTAAGGQGPYLFSFNLYYQDFDAQTNKYTLIAGNGGKEGDKLTYHASPSYSFTIPNYGRYVLRVGVKDEEGSTLVWQSEFFTTDTLDEAMSKKVAQLVSLCKSQASGAYAKVKWVHDWLCDNARYDQSAAIEYGHYYAESALLEGVTVCQGYTLAARILLTELGIPNIVVTGTAGGAHSWNMVQLGGSWYHMDITWDDTSGGHAYFLVPDGVMARNHTWAGSYTEGSAVYPACTATQYYKPVMDGYLPFANGEELADLLAAQAASGAGSFRIVYVGTPSFAVNTAVSDWFNENRYALSLEQYEFKSVSAYMAQITFTPYANRTDVSSVTCTPEASSFTYTGRALTPEVTVKNGAVTLAEGIDYTLSYSSNTMPGTAYVTVTGIGAYKGEVKKSFTIKAAQLSECTVTARDAVYTGSAVDPEVTVSRNGYAFAKGRDYTVELPADMTSTGEKTVTVRGAGPLTGEKTVTMRVLPRDITKAVVQDPGVQIWTGSPRTPQIRLKLDGEWLTEGTDYTIDYENNTDPGTARAIVTGMGNCAGTFTYEFTIVRLAVKSITLSNDEITVHQGAEYGGLRYVISPIASSMAEVMWDSTNPNIASVDANGRIYGVSEGHCIVSVTVVDGGLKAMCSVTVLPALPDELALARTSADMGVGETMPVGCSLLPVGSVSKITYRSSKSTVASVDANGIIRAKAVGTCEITATSENNITVTMTVTVKKAPGSVSMSVPAAQIGVTESMPVEVSTPSGTGGTVEVTSSDSAVLRVNADGSVTGVSAGKAVLRAKTYNGKKKEITVTVGEIPTHASLSRAQLTLGEGQEFTLTCEHDGIWYRPSWSTDDASCVRCADGKLTAAGTGTATVTFRAGNAQAECLVTVVPAAQEVFVPFETAVIGKGASIEIPYSFPAGTYAGVAATSSSGKIASVTSSEGKVTVTGVNPGTARITLTAHTGASAVVVMTVRQAPTSVRLAYQRRTLGVGESEEGTVTLSKGSAAALTFVSTDENVLTVDGNGKVTAVGTGTAQIQVRTHNNRKFTAAAITVKNAPDSVGIGTSRELFGADETGTLTAALPEGCAGAYTFASDRPDVFEIDPAKGTYRAVSRGTANVTVTTYNGVSCTRTVRVLPAPQEVLLSASSATIGKGDSVSFRYSFPEGTAGTVKVTSSNKKAVQAVVEEGLVTLKGLQTGTANVTVTAHNGVSAIFTLTVAKAPTSMSVSCPRKEMGVGETARITTVLPKGTTATLTYRSEDENVLRVSADGTVMAVAPGQTRILVQTHNGVKRYTGDITVMDAPTGVTFTIDRFSIGAAEKGKASCALPAGTAGSCEFFADDPQVLSIDPETGAYTALSAGTTRVGVRTYNGHVDSAAVTVFPAPDRIILSQDSATLGKGDTVSFSYSFPEGTMGTATVKTSSNAVSEIRTDGDTVTVRAKSRGSARVTVTAHNGVSATFVLIVRNAPLTAKISYGSYKIGVGETVPCTLTLTKNTVASVTYTSSDESVLTADGEGRVTAVGTGSAYISVKTHNGVKGKSGMFTVLEAPSTLLIGIGKETFGVGEKTGVTVTLDTVGQVAFASDNPNVVSIDENGQMNALAVGKATVSATSYNGLSDRVSVTVVKAAESVSFSQGSVVIGVGETVLVQYTLPAGTAAGSTLTNTYRPVASCAEVENGVVSVKGLKKGTTKITVKLHTGASASLNVRVNAAPSYIKLTAPQETLGKGETVQTKVTISSGASSAITYLSSNENAVLVDANGLITAVNTGSSLITARTFNGRESSVLITVKQAPASVSVASTTLTLGIKEKCKIEVTLPGDSAGKCTYTSSNESIAKVDPDTGEVTGVTTGSATITVTTYNGKKASVKVSVKTNNKMESLLALAKSKLGCKYVYGKKGPDTFDCSGFTSYLYKTVYGVSLSGSAYGQGYNDAPRFTIIKDISALKAGDILCFNTTETDGDLSDHVALYLGNKTFIHASQTAGKVITSTFTAYYNRVFFRAFRVVK